VNYDAGAMEPELVRALLSWDAQATLALNGLAGAAPPRAWELGWQAVTLLGTGMIVVPVALAAWEGRAAGRRRFALRALVALAAVGIAAGLAALVLKPLVARPRPAAALASVHVVGDALYGLGFPSGHATAAGAGAAAIAVLQRRRRSVGVAAAVGAALVALSRVALGQHYVLDVLAGLLLGAAIAAPLALWGLGRAAVGDPTEARAPSTPT